MVPALIVTMLGAGLLGGGLAAAQQPAPAAAEPSELSAIELQRRIEALELEIAQHADALEAARAVEQLTTLLRQRLERFQQGPSLVAAEQELARALDELGRLVLSPRRVEALAAASDRFVRLLDAELQRLEDEVTLAERAFLTPRGNPQWEAASRELINALVPPIDAYRRQLEAYRTEADRLLGELAREAEGAQPSATMRTALEGLRSAQLEPLLPGLELLRRELLTLVDEQAAKVRAEIDAESALLAAARAEQRAVITEMADRQLRLEQAQQQLAQAEAELGSSRAFDQQLITLGLLAFGVVLLLVLLIPRLYPAVIQRSMFETGLVPEIVTIVFLTGTVLLLGAAGKLQTEILGTLLGAVGGFLLGRTVGGYGRRTVMVTPPAQPPQSPVGPQISLHGSSRAAAIEAEAQGGVAGAARPREALGDDG